MSNGRLDLDGIGFLEAFERRGLGITGHQAGRYFCPGAMIEQRNQELNHVHAHIRHRTDVDDQLVCPGCVHLGDFFLCGAVDLGTLGTGDFWRQGQQQKIPFDFEPNLSICFIARG